MSETDKPADPLTIITVKGIEVVAWQRARKCAAANDEMMGPWLTRAINLLADRQEGDGVFPPGAVPDKPAEPAGLNPDALRDAILATEMAQRILAMAVARPLKVEAQRILDTALLATLSLPPRDRPLSLPRTISPARSDKPAAETARLEAADGARRPVPEGSGRAHRALAGRVPAESTAAG